jgi:hypothetical protein
MQLNFKAFVEGEPDALSNKTLQTGAFRQQRITPLITSRIDQG